MIAVKRTACPDVLKRNARKWDAELNAAVTPIQEKRALERYRHRDVKRALVEMFHGKCAYCESKIAHIDYGDIEHYLPKSGPCQRRDLVFSWDNLLLACGVCNGWKGSRSPTAQEGGPYVNPCTHDPASHFYFEYDPIAKISNVRGKTRRGTKTEEDLGLNRPELREHRSKRMLALMVVAQFAASAPEARSIIQEAKSETSEYAAFARALL